MDSDVEAMPSRRALLSNEYQTMTSTAVVGSDSFGGELAPRLLQACPDIGKVGPADFQTKRLGAGAPEDNAGLAQQGAGAGTNGEDRQVKVERAEAIQAPRGARTGDF